MVYTKNPASWTSWSYPTHQCKPKGSHISPKGIIADAWLTAYCESGFVFSVPTIGGSSYDLFLKWLVTTCISPHWSPSRTSTSRTPATKGSGYDFTQFCTPGGHMLGWDHQKEIDLTARVNTWMHLTMYAGSMCWRVLGQLDIKTSERKEF